MESDARSQLGNAYLEHGKNAEAEEAFQKALALAPSNLDALIGVAEIFKGRGDPAEKARKGAEAEEQYARAAAHFEQVLTLVESEDVSKILNKTELSAVYYSLGYTRVKLSELQNHRDTTLLASAQKCFDAVGFGTPNYYKAQTAKQRIEERTAGMKQATSNWGSGVVVLLALVAFGLGQLAFFVGKPVFGRSFYSVDMTALAPLIKQHDLDAGLVEEVAGTEYFSVQQGVKRLEALTAGKIKRDSLEKLLNGSGSLGIKGLEPIGDTIYGLLTFGGLLFVVAGLYLREVSKLKFGAIEMEKTATETRIVSASLGISK